MTVVVSVTERPLALNEAADQETEPEKKGKLRALAEGLKDVGYRFAVDTLAAYADKKT